MKKIIPILSIAAFSVLSSCGDKKSTGQLANEMVTQVESLPAIVKSIEDEASAEAAASEIDALRASLRGINEQVKKGVFLSAKERGEVERRLRATRGETEFLLQQLSGKPELILMLTDPLAALGGELEVSRRLMKEGAQEGN